MPFLIDGHNLIPKVPGLSLEAMDDEHQLIEMLQEYCRLQRKQVEVFFDQAAPGGAVARKYGQVVAHFVRQETTADKAIHQKLRRLGRASRNWTVVSSDQEIQAEARSVQAHTLSSEEFARMLVKALSEKPEQKGGTGDGGLSPAEVDEWLDLFSTGQEP
jgi:predicted RNA-binding protein with PIN domain